MGGGRGGGHGRLRHMDKRRFRTTYLWRGMRDRSVSETFPQGSMGREEGGGVWPIHPLPLNPDQAEGREEGGWRVEGGGAEGLDFPALRSLFVKSPSNPAPMLTGGSGPGRRSPRLVPPPDPSRLVSHLPLGSIPNAPAPAKSKTQFSCKKGPFLLVQMLTPLAQMRRDPWNHGGFC